MRHFPICKSCRDEYENPADRRFHAEPVACSQCGPQLALWSVTGDTLALRHDAVAAAAAAVRQGKIVAVKGIGGFHLIADARNEDAIRRLRLRKRRHEKPFAVMFPTLAKVAVSCSISPADETLLNGPARPIVLLRRMDGPIAPSVAPGNPWLGALLPYTPLHHLLMKELGFPVVATSGNVSDEPIVTDETEALARLGGIADLFLVHDRRIVRPVDDSVARVVCGRELILRRARGYAPVSIAIANIPSGISSYGRASQNGRRREPSKRRGFEPAHRRSRHGRGSAAHARAVADAARLHGVQVRCVARDLHPDYASSQAAEAMGLPVVTLQHHLAHVVACMAEHGIAPPVLGVAWDGTGYGSDGTVWGGEFLLVTEAGWRRIAHLRPFPLPGGDAAVREPRRAALGLLYEAFGEDALTMTGLPPVASFSPEGRKFLRAQLAGSINAPSTSSAGRLFDGFAALCGLRQLTSYEGQAAAELEGAADGSATGHRYDLPIRRAREEAAPLVIDWQPALESALGDLGSGAAPGGISEALHNGLAIAIAEVARRAAERRVVLTGGCFQNARLTEVPVTALRAVSCEAIWHRRVPPNDGGIALGQAVWAAWEVHRGGRPCA
jgi:hydrogenase maturation protein HypF